MLAHHFIRRGYPKHLILEKMRLAASTDREQLLNNEILKKASTKTDGKDDFFLVTTYNPRNPDFREIVNKNWPLLEKTKTTRQLMGSNIIYGNRRNKNISDFLVRASTSNKHKKLKTIERNPCPKPTKCRYCPQLNKSGVIKSHHYQSEFKAKKRNKLPKQKSNLLH